MRRPAEKPAKVTKAAEPGPTNVIEFAPGRPGQAEPGGVASAPETPASAAKDVSTPAQTTRRVKPAAGRGQVRPAHGVRPKPTEAGRRAAPTAPARRVDDSQRGTKPAGPPRRVRPVQRAAPTADQTTPETSASTSGIGSVDEFLALAAQLAALVFGPGGEERAAQAVEFLRRRLTGDYEVDPFGFDAELTETVLLPLLRPLYRRWFRVRVTGAANLPADGPALVVANHSGTLPLDSLMTQVAVHDEHPAQRHLRVLGADLVFQLPFVGDLARTSGTTLACNEDAERLFAAGELVGVWPEGFKGIGKPFSERYKLQRFGRGGFVAAAIRARAPIVPCAIVGAEETYPMVGNLRTVARLLGLPYLPITPTFPWLGVLGLVPLPSKWLIEFGEPIPTAGYGPGAAEDPTLVFELTDRVRETIQQTLHTLLARRSNIFF
ncbi:MAG: 1-acyl-sn-glycerol-3-phosphate acyltransferase [Jiangellaceae bacterium]|nr:1-acyl-sn-glycerol-3-phosphate acyltransferase [Jiangellaceae bacterium]